MSGLTIIRDESRSKMVVDDTLVDSYTATTISDPIDLAFCRNASVTMEWTNETPTAIDFAAGTKQVDTVTFDTLANSVAGEFLVINDAAGDDWAIAGLKQLGTKNKKTINFDDKASTTGGDHIIIPDQPGDDWAIGLDVSGTDEEPTSAEWLAVPEGRKVFVDISGVANDEDIAALVVTAFELLTGLTYDLTDQLDGTVEFLSKTVGTVAECTPLDADGTGVGSIASVETTAGVASDTAPTLSPKWTAIPSAKKATVDLSATNTAAEVAAAYEVAFDALVGFTAKVVTDDGAGDGSMLFQHQVLGPVDAPVAYDGTVNDDVAAGFTITDPATTPYVATTVDITANTITMTAHGLETGAIVKVSSDGTQPAPLELTPTVYYVIKVDANTIKLATSAANALAGTAVDITSIGADGNTHTLTAEALAGCSVKLQEVNDLTDTWHDIANTSNNITAAGKVVETLSNFESRFLRAVFTITTGQVGLKVRTCYKELI